MKEDKGERIDRRSFFGAAGKGLALGVGAVAVAAGGAEAAEEPSDETGTYRETDHVKTYYDLARF